MHILLQHLAVPNLSIFEGYWQKMISLREFRINICIYVYIKNHLPTILIANYKLLVRLTHRIKFDAEISRS